MTKVKCCNPRASYNWTGKKKKQQRIEDVFQCEHSKPSKRSGAETKIIYYIIILGNRHGNECCMMMSVCMVSHKTTIKTNKNNSTILKTAEKWSPSEVETGQRLTWLYLALATCLVSIFPYWGGLQENSTNNRSCSKMAGYITWRFSEPTQIAWNNDIQSH